MQEPKHIFITGAGSGLGAALARHYAAPGVMLSLTGRSLARLEEVRKSCAALGADAAAASIDVRDEAALKSWMETRDAVRPLDLVIANAGISGGTGSAAGRSSEPAAQVKEIMDINVSGVLNTIHAALDLMQPKKRGQIAIISSIASFIAHPGAPAYCTSKAAVRFYGEALRPLLAQENIEVNVVCPGYVKTPMTDVNDFPMPFIMSAEKAATLIQRGLAANRGRIAFPLPLYAAAQLIGLLPVAAKQALLIRAPGKD